MHDPRQVRVHEPRRSVKDRAALFIIRDAEARGVLQPGGTIVEGTAGNTGIGLAVVANALGYRTVIVMPDTQSQRKAGHAARARRGTRARAAAQYSSRRATTSTPSRRLAEETPGAVWANQFDNIANRRAHIKTHRARDLGADRGRVDGFTCAVGTGGTLAGVAHGAQGVRSRHHHRADRSRRRGAVRLVTPTASCAAEGSSVSEGIGQSRITANLDGLHRSTRSSASPTPKRCR